MFKVNSMLVVISGLNPKKICYPWSHAFLESQAINPRKIDLPVNAVIHNNLSEIVDKVNKFAYGFP